MAETKSSTDKSNDADTGPSKAQIGAAKRLFAGPSEFATAAVSVESLPPMGLPEIAFAGRSNVGKSSLLNALTGRRALARTSQTPGRTRQLNFFDLSGRLLLVDMPGLGYARAPKSEITAWNELIGAYLRGRTTLRRLCLLVDARHGLKAADRELIELLDQAAVSYQIVLTKQDKAKKTLAAVSEKVAEELTGHAAALPEILVTSAKTGAGIDALRAALAAFAAPE